MSLGPETETTPAMEGRPQILSHRAAQAGGDQPRLRLILDPKATEGSGRYPELRITHSVLDSDLSHLAKLLLPTLALRRSGYVSRTDIRAIIPTSPRALSEAIREAEEKEWLHVERPNQRDGARFTKPYFFKISREANPHSKGKYWTRLPLTPELRAQRSAARWILLAVCHREQARRGAIHLPDALLARQAGVSVQALKDARADWLRTGTLQRLTNQRPAVYALTSSPYSADLDKFEADRYRLVPLSRAGETVQVWATEAQAETLTNRLQHEFDRQTARELLHSNPHPILSAPEAFDLLTPPKIEQWEPSEEEFAALVAEAAADDEIPF